MKRTLCLLLCIGMILTLSSCWWRRNPSPTAGTTAPSVQVPSTGAPSTGATVATDPTVDTQPSVQLPSLPMVSVSLPLIHEITHAADGAELFRYSFQDVALNITDADVAKIVTLDLLQRMDSSARDIADLQAQAAKEYTAGAEWTPYYFEVIYTPGRIDETVLSLYGTHSSYNGKAHPTASMSSATYDLVTGKFLSLNDILLDKAKAADAMCTALIAELDKIAKDKGLFSGYAATIQSSFAVDLNRHYAWYFTEDGICFYFSPYEIAPNSAGTIEVSIPYSKLTGILKDDYYPVEQPDIAGNLSAGWFDEADLNSFTHFSELIDKPDARRSILWVDTVIYSVRLEQGHWDTTENKFISDSTVFASNCIAEGDALTLRCELSDTTPTLLLHYISDGKPQSCYITKDHATGAVTLTPVK